MTTNNKDVVNRHEPTPRTVVSNSTKNGNQEMSDHNRDRITWLLWCFNFNKWDSRVFAACVEVQLRSMDNLSRNSSAQFPDKLSRPSAAASPLW